MFHTSENTMETDAINHLTINQMRYRLERNHRKLQSLAVKLSSYKCEPRDYDCFERLYGIQHDIRNFKKQRSRLQEEFRIGGYGSEESLGKLMRDQLTSFEELEDKIGAYFKCSSRNYVSFP